MEVHHFYYYLSYLQMNDTIVLVNDEVTYRFLEHATRRWLVFYLMFPASETSFNTAAQTNV